MRPVLSILLALMLAYAALGLSGCGGNQIQTARTETTDAWESLVRWSQFDALIDFIHPEYLSEQPISQLDVDRLHQFRVTEYRVRQVLVDPDGRGLERLARLRLYHVHSAQERVVDHREVWRYDETLGRWLLHSGLPDPRQR